MLANRQTGKRRWTQYPRSAAGDIRKKEKKLEVDGKPVGYCLRPNTDWRVHAHVHTYARTNRQPENIIPPAPSVQYNGRSDTKQLRFTNISLLNATTMHNYWKPAVETVPKNSRRWCTMQSSISRLSGSLAAEYSAARASEHPVRRGRFSESAGARRTI